MRRLLLSCLLVGLVLAAMAATAADGPPAVRAALARMAPGVEITHLAKAPMPGFYQALLGGRMVYVSADGTWIMDGHLYNADKQLDASARSMRAVRREALAKVPAAHFITFAPAHPKYSVTVFTDLDCAYCRVFHRHIKQYNAEGIAVHYLSWPRAGLKAVPSGKPTASYLKSVSVWCAKNRKTAFNEAIAGRPVAPVQCANSVAAQFHLGERIGVDGTPTLIAPDGSVLGGYLPPDQLLRALQDLRGSDAENPPHS